MSETSSRVTFFPNLEVEYCKIQSTQDGSIPDIAEAALNRKKVDVYSILVTDFPGAGVPAYYFDQSNEAVGGTCQFYRKVPGSNYYDYICTFKNKQYAFTDYNVLSNQYYHYFATIEVPSPYEGEPPVYFKYNNTIKPKIGDLSEVDRYIKVKLDSWTICDIIETSEESVYQKTGDLWELGLNLSSEDVTINTNFTSWDTLGRYPVVSAGSRRYESMTFTGLLGSIKKYYRYDIKDQFVQELNDEKKKDNVMVYPTYNDVIQTFGGHEVTEYTEKRDTFNNRIANLPNTPQDERWNVWHPYARETDKLAAWREFITNGEMKLLRDTKGNSWIVQISDSSNYSINTASNLNQTTITFSWKEVKDASTISVIYPGIYSTIEEGQA